MIQCDWFLAALVCGLIRSLRSKLSNFTCRLQALVVGKGQIGQLKPQLSIQRRPSTLGLAKEIRLSTLS